MVEGVLGYLPKDGKVLFVLRRDEPYAKMWALPGGHVESTERPEERIVKEFLQETNLAVMVIGKINEEPLVIPEHDLSINVFEVAYRGGEIRAGDDASAAMLFSKKERTELRIAPPVRRFLRDYNL